MYVIYIKDHIYHLLNKSKVLIFFFAFVPVSDPPMITTNLARA